jgi:ribonuclease HI
MPAMAAGEVLTTARIEADVPSLDPAPADLAPAPLQTLLSRLELAERFADQGYGLSLVELAQLVEQPLQQLERRSSPWRWRDWQVLPLEGGRWRLQRDAGGLGDRE